MEIRLPWLLVRSNQFLACEKLLKRRIVSDWVPDWINLELRDGNGKTRRHRQQSLQCFDRRGRFACPGLNLSQTGKNRRAGDSVFLDGRGLCRLRRQTKGLTIIFQR